MRHTAFLLLFLTGSFMICQGQQMTSEEYVAQYKDMAIREMKRMGVPAAITLAQGILETESGNSDLVKRSNNHFGIKCKSSWTAATVSHDDDETGECFRAYDDAEDSYRDHSNFLRGNDRYSFLFKLDPKDYKGWAYGLRKAGYATNPRYPEILIRQIETYQLQQYTLQAAGEVPVYHDSKFSDDIEEVSVQNIENAPVHEIKYDVSAKLSINGSRAIWSAKGTSLLAIATSNKINLSRLLEMNDLKKDGLLKKDQLIFLEKKQKEGDRDFYVVQEGETLYDVSQKNGVILKNLLEINNLSFEEVTVGNKILLRPRVAASIENKLITEAQFTNQSAQATTHEVQPKEGLYSISKKYGITVSQLKDWNNLESDQIQIGQRLLISK